MTMTPNLRTFALTAHTVFSVGWLGAVVAYLALAITGLTSDDAQVVRAAYCSMELIGWHIIVPLSLVALLSGLVQSLGTQWGLLRHYWIVVKFLLTIGATAVLLHHMQTVSRVADMVASEALAGADFPALRIQLMVHAAGGLLVLLVVTTLSMYKPWGLTAYGRRRQSQRRNTPRTTPASLPGPTSADAESVRGTTTGTPRWVYIVGFHAIGLLLLFVILHLAGIAPQSH